MNVILTLSALGLVTLFTGVYNARKMLMPLVIFGLLCALAINAIPWYDVTSAAGGTTVYSGYIRSMMNFDHYAIAFSALLIVSSIFIFFLCD
jgi:NADH-quinone oxidoreductase subunit N